MNERECPMKRLTLPVSVALVPLLLIAPGLPGCETAAAHSGTLSVGPAEKVKVVRQTTTRWLTEGELAQYGTGDEPISLPFGGTAADRAIFAARLKSETTATSDRLAPLLIAGGAWLLEKGLGALSDHLKKVAKEYQAEIPGEALSYNFWNGDKAGSRFHAIEIRRDSVKRTENSEGDVTNSSVLANRFQMILYMRKATARPNESLFALTPMLWVENGAEARTGSGRVLSAVVEVSLDAAWVDANGVAHNATIMEDTFMVDRYKAGIVGKDGVLETNGEVYITEDDLDHQSHWFALPPAADGRPVAVTANVKVTEVDQSRAKKFLEGIAGLIEDNKGKIVDGFKEKVGGK